MDIDKLLKLLEAKDLSTWRDLSASIERRSDASAAEQALMILDEQRQSTLIAMWLAQIADHSFLQGLRAMLFERSIAWQIGSLRTLACNLLSSNFRCLSPGSFVMGSPFSEVKKREFDENHETQTPMEIKNAFCMKTTPVTQAEWELHMNYNPSTFKGDSQRPVEGVSWYEAITYCNILSQKEGLNAAYTISNPQGEPGGRYYYCDVKLNDRPCTGYRLPLSFEWEYAARAGTTTAFYSGDWLSVKGIDPNLHPIAWYNGNSNDTTHPVKGKIPNPWGLYDMLGNVFEWCFPMTKSNVVIKGNEWHHRNHYFASRPIRGGSWNSPTERCRSATVGRYDPSTRVDIVGLRLVQDLEQIEVGIDST